MNTTETSHPQQIAELAPSTCSAPFILFAAHAPEIPTWFKRLEWQEEVVEPTNDGRIGWVHKVTKTRMEEPMAYLIRWRMAYATAMVAALPNAQDQRDGCLAQSVPSTDCDKQSASLHRLVRLLSSSEIKMRRYLGCVPSFAKGGDAVKMLPSYSDMIQHLDDVSEEIRKVRRDFGIVPQSDEAME